MSVNVNDDYASIDFDGGAMFYYGYEVQDENDNWCFEAISGNHRIVIPISPNHCLEPAKGLMEGISLLFGGIIGSAVIREQILIMKAVQDRHKTGA